jgi:hypothetical protein
VIIRNLKSNGKEEILKKGTGQVMAYKIRELMLENFQRTACLDKLKFHDKA